MTTHGRCACGAVTFSVTGELRAITNCHCDECRRWTGHHMAATAAPRDTIAIDDETHLRWWARTPAVEYGFCDVCGSSLFWREVKGANVSITAGSLDHPLHLTTDTALFMDHHGDYHTPEPVDHEEPLDRMPPHI